MVSAQMTIPGPTGIPMAVPKTTRIQVQTMKDTMDRILALSIPKVTFSSSHRIADHTRTNPRMYTLVKIIA